MEGRGEGGTALAFAAFVLAHDGCGVVPSEFRLDGDSLASWCPRCDEVRVFGPTEERKSAW